MPMLEAADKQAYDKLCKALRTANGPAIGIAIRALMLVMRIENFQPFEKLFRTVNAPVLLCAHRLPGGGSLPVPAKVKRGATRYSAFSATLQKKTYMLFVAVDSFPFYLFDESDSYAENFAKLADAGFLTVH